MKRKQITSILGLIRAGEVAAGAATEVGAGIGLNVNIAGTISADLNALIEANRQVELGKAVMQARWDARDTAVEQAHGFVTQGRDALKVELGYEHSDSWTMAGLPSSLQVPTTVVGLTGALRGIGEFMTNNPALELPTRNVTAARAAELLANLVAAQEGVASQKLTLTNLRRVRREKAAQMQLRLRLLARELSVLLTPLDALWNRFGFPMPGAQSLPDVPANVVAVLIGNNAIAVNWNSAARAERYRVWKRVVGIDAEMVLVGTRDDLDFIIEGLPSNSQVEIAVSAINSGGESEKSTVVTVTMLQS